MTDNIHESPCLSMYTPTTREVSTIPIQRNQAPRTGHAPWPQPGEPPVKPMPLLLLLCAGWLLATPGCAPQIAPAVQREEPTNIDLYARELEARLHRRYNNTPRYAGRVAVVNLVESRPRKTSVDGLETQVEWSQIVVDKWGKRIPELEEEYYVVTFGDGLPRRQTTRPSLTVGMHTEGGFSEFESANQGRLKALPHRADPRMFDADPDAPVDGPMRHEPRRQAPGCGGCDAYMPGIDAPSLRRTARAPDTIPVIPAVEEHLMPVVVHPHPTPARSVTADAVGVDAPLRHKTPHQMLESILHDEDHFSGGPLGGRNHVNR